MYLQLGLVDGTEQVPVALGCQSLMHRPQVRTVGHVRRHRVAVPVDRRQADHVQPPIGSAFQSRRLFSRGTCISQRN